MNRWCRIDNFIARVEKFLVVFLLGAMILVAFLQIVLRNVFTTGFSWGDPFIRYLVVWVGFIGAALATKEGKHITIEIVWHHDFSVCTPFFHRTVCHFKNCFPSRT